MKTTRECCTEEDFVRCNAIENSVNPSGCDAFKSAGNSM